MRRLTPSVTRVVSVSRHIRVQDQLTKTQDLRNQIEGRVSKYLNSKTVQFNGSFNKFEQSVCEVISCIHEFKPCPRSSVHLLH
jgi:hypothetical protein